jgi:hypothetical protein
VRCYFGYLYAWSKIEVILEHLLECRGCDDLEASFEGEISIAVIREELRQLLPFSRFVQLCQETVALHYTESIGQMKICENGFFRIRQLRLARISSSSTRKAAGGMENEDLNCCTGALT